METVCIDKIVILCEASSGLNNYLIHGTYVKKCYPKKKSYFYQLCYEFVDGTHLLISTYGNGIRLSFNPENCIPENIHALLTYCHDIKISRLDIAINYWEDLSLYIWLEKSGRRKIKSYRDEIGKLSTVYFGKRKSQTTYIIYNKSLQMETTGTWWRVEARVRNPNIKDILPDNIFEPIFAGGTEKFPPKDSHLTRLKRFPEHIKKLAPLRRKQARRLAMASYDKLDLQPSVIYNSFRAEMFASLSRYIIIPPTEQNYTEMDTYDISNDLISYIYFVHKR
jgi:hypothetical protein